MLIYNDWSVIEQQGKYWICQCCCGVVRKVVGYDVKSNKSKGCGCKRKKALAEAAKIKNTKHGKSDQTEQRIWSDMKRRCYNPSRKDFIRYGGRGITVCDSWMFGNGEISGFHCFLVDMGNRPSNLYTLDRIDNEKGYSKENCRWASKLEQDYNKRNTFKFQAFGREWNLLEASIHTGINSSTIYGRIKTYGMTGEQAMQKKSD